MPLFNLSHLTILQRKRLPAVLCFCFWLFLPCYLLGQPFTPDPDWCFENFNNQNHFTSSPVSQLAVDPKGYVWATGNSLLRFDGSSMVAFNGNGHSNTSLRSTYPGLVCDNSGKVWISSHGLCRYDEAADKFIYVKTDPKHNIIDAESFCIQGSYLWFVCEFGLAKFDTRSLQISYTSLTGIHDPLCSGLIDDSTLLVSSREKIYFYHINTGKWIARTLVYNGSLLKVFCIHKVGGQLFLGTNNGLFMLVAPDKIIAICPETRDIGIDDMAVLPADKEQKYILMAAEGNGIQVYNTALQKIQFSYLHDDNNPYSIPSNGISAFFMDSAGRLWMGCDIGISMLDISDQRFKVRLLDKTNAYQAGINKIAADKYDSTKVWLCSYSQGMIRVNWKTKQVEKMFNQVPYARRLYDFSQVSKDRWLLATQKEIIEWSPRTGPISRLKLPVPDSLALICNIRRLIMAGNNTCYITTNHGLYKYDLSRRKISAASATSTLHKGCDPLKYILLEGFADNNVLWIASRNGVFKYDLTTGAATIYRGKGNSGDYYLFDIANASTNELVCAAGEGVLVFNKRDNSFRVVNSLGNFYKPGCGSIITLKNTAWIAAYGGIFTYDLVTHRSEETQLSNSLSDLGPTSSFTLMGKYIVYGLRDGFAYFSPETKNEAAPSDPVIEKIYVNNQPLFQNYKNAAPDFDYSHNSLNIAFTAFLYKHPEDIRFRYRLKGGAGGWQNADNQRGANYAQLSPGNYTFYVQCGNKNGVWNSHLASFKFTVDPPYWATWWFRSLVVAAVVFALYRSYRYKIEHLQAIEKIRASIAADFHDDLGSTLSSISIFSQVAIQKAETDLQATKSMMGDIGIRARAMIHSMNDMVWIIKPDNDNLYKLMQRMEEFGYPIAEAKEIPLSFVMDNSLFGVKIDMLIRKNLFLVFKEAFNNAVKYACPKNIFVQFALKQKRILIMQILDNGCGFKVSDGQKGNGLGNMQKRAAEIKGKLKIDSAPGSGTTITVVCEIT